jgi:hypothetical protein
MENKKMYLGVADMAKILKKELRSRFPNTKFSVVSSSYSGGCSIDVYYTDGPAFEDVDKIVQSYRGKGFDGMIDMSFYYELYLNKDGFLRTYKSEGTADCMGVYNAYSNKLPEGAILVNTSHPYTFTNRKISEEIREKAARDMAKYMGIEYIDMQQRPRNTSYENWYYYTGKILYNANLDGFKGVRDTDCTCGNYEEFYEVYTE